MKRLLIIVVVFLLAGAVVNLAVAWVCSTKPNAVDAAGYEFLDHIYYPDPYDTEWVEWWAARAPEGFASEPNLFVLGTAEFGITTLTFGFSEAEDLENIREPEQQVTRLRSGLPMPSMEGAAWGGSSSARTIYDAAIKLPHDDASSPSLLLRPVWPGFAVNTLLYATVLWSLICGPFVVRRWVRVRRGLCPKCAYPRSESAVCSECGKALSRHMS